MPPTFTPVATATRLKVTGINLYSAGDFADGDDREEIVLRDATAGVYKRLILRDDRIVGAVLYGDTGDGPWFFDMLTRSADTRDMRDTLIFGQSYHGGPPLDATAAVAAFRAKRSATLPRTTHDLCRRRTPSFAPPVPIAALAAASSRAAARRLGCDRGRSGSSRPIAAGSAQRARRWARPSRSRAGCCIPRLAAGRVGWDEALDLVAQRFRDTIAEHGPDSVAIYGSGQLLTEDYYVANKLMKGFIGSANIDTNSRLCMASSVAGHKRAFGSDTVPGNYEDLDEADLIVLVGANLAWCHPGALPAHRQRPRPRGPRCASS